MRLDCAHGLARAKPKNFPYFSYFPRRGCGGADKKWKGNFWFCFAAFILFFNLIYGSKYFQSVNNWLEAQSGLGELVFDLWRHDGVRFAFDQAVLLKFFERLDKHSVRHFLHFVNFFFNSPYRTTFVSYTSTQIIMPFHLPSMALRASWSGHTYSRPLILYFCILSF